MRLFLIIIISTALHALNLDAIDPSLYWAIYVGILLAVVQDVKEIIKK